MPQDSSLQIRNSPRAFALYEVLIGVTIFAVGVLALGRAVENCLNASTLNAEEERVRQILSNRMAEVQAGPDIPDAAKELKIDTGYGIVKLIQKNVPAGFTEPGNVQLSGINLVTLTVQWMRGGITQSKQIRFYVYRPRSPKSDIRFKQTGRSQRRLHPARDHAGGGDSRYDVASDLSLRAIESHRAARFLRRKRGRRA